MSMALEAYTRLIARLKMSRRVIGGVADYLDSPDTAKVILRHDVDRRPRKSVQIAELEFNSGIHSTFYFRVSTSGRLAERCIKEIAAFGHEVGYHTETLSDCDGDRRSALQLFEGTPPGFEKSVPVAR